MVKIAPSILSSDFSRLGEEVKRVELAGADIIHIDVMDGHFVPNLTFGPPVVAAIKKVTKLPFDVHLMVSNPENYIESFAEAGADIISVHVEVANHLHRILQSIHHQNVKAAVAVNPATPLTMVEEILDEVDMVLLMSVNPGFGGQKFIPSVLHKIERLNNMIKATGKNIDIEVDGGINSSNARAVIQAGATVLVAGSAVYGASNIDAAIRGLRQ